MAAIARGPFRQYGSVRPIAQALDEIFAVYLTPRKRPQGRQNALDVASPPDYDPATEVIAQVVMEKPRRALVYTRDTRPFGKELCYVLLKRGDKWLLDSKKIKYTTGWERYAL